jgi:hypothetical protein
VELHFQIADVWSVQLRIADDRDANESDRHEERDGEKPRTNGPDRTASVESKYVIALNASTPVALKIASIPSRLRICESKMF